MRIEATKTTTVNIDAEFASLEEFREKHPGFTIDAIDDKEVVALCEVCGQPIFEGDDYHTGDEDLIYVHASVECAPPAAFDPGTDIDGAWTMGTDEDPI